MNWLHVSIPAIALCLAMGPSKAEDLSLDCDMKMVVGDSLKFKLQINGDVVSLLPLGPGAPPLTEFKNGGKNYVRISDSVISFGSDREGLTIDRYSGELTIKRPPTSAKVSDRGQCEKAETPARKF